MNKISLYLFLVLVYLGIAKSLSPSQNTTLYIENEYSFADSFVGSPLVLILTDSFHTGFLIPTYFQRYKAVYVFKESEEFIVRVSEEFWHRTLPFLGMTMFHRDENDSIHITPPLPAGALFVGDLAYGAWEKNEDKTHKVWSFNSAYRMLPEIFNWGDYQPNIDFYNMMQAHIEHNIPFFGPQKEFGTEGSITKIFYEPHAISRERFRFTLVDIFESLYQKFSQIQAQPQEVPPILPATTQIEEIRPMLGEQEEKAKPQQKSIFSYPLGGEENE